MTESPNNDNEPTDPNIQPPNLPTDSSEEILPRTSEEAPASPDAPPPAPPSRLHAPKTLSARFAEKQAKKKQKEIDELKKRGLDDRQVAQFMARREHEAQPIQQRLMRLEAMVVQSFQQLAQEMTALRQNDEILADAMDVNFRSIARALELAGVTLDKQGEIIQQVQVEVQEERRKAMEEEAIKKAAVKRKAEEDALAAKVDAPPAAPTDNAPQEASQFGG